MSRRMNEATRGYILESGGSLKHPEAVGSLIALRTEQPGKGSPHCNVIPEVDSQKGTHLKNASTRGDPATGSPRIARRFVLPLVLIDLKRSTKANIIHLAIDAENRIGRDSTRKQRYALTLEPLHEFGRIS